MWDGDITTAQEASCSVAQCHNPMGPACTRETDLGRGEECTDLMSLQIPLLANKGGGVAVISWTNTLHSSAVKSWGLALQPLYTYFRGNTVLIIKAQPEGPPGMKLRINWAAWMLIQSREAAMAFSFLLPPLWSLLGFSIWPWLGNWSC